MTESIDYLTLDDVLEVADGIIDGVVVRDMGLLASAVARPQTTVFGEDAYPTLSDKAAALMHSLARNHALVDGNKRLAWAAARVFCLLNGHDVQFASLTTRKPWCWQWPRVTLTCLPWRRSSPITSSSRRKSLRHRGAGRPQVLASPRLPAPTCRPRTPCRTSVGHMPSCCRRRRRP